MASEIPNRHQPSFVLWPLQNARTAWQAVYLPVILVVPHRRTPEGTEVLNTEVFDVVFKIENAQNRIPVAGERYQGLTVPNFDLFRREVSELELSARKINIESARFKDKTTGEDKESADAIEGDLLVITTESGDLTDSIPWYPDADYYDLSTISIETHPLEPPGKYVFSWNAHYYGRIVTDRGELFCIDDGGIRLARIPLIFDHPGDMLLEMQEKTPDFVFTGSRPDTDQALKFLRPYSDVLQDVFDETSFLERINHVDHIPSSYIPYLSYLLGWNLPFFPGSTDTMRRRVLRNARKLQGLKGSKAAIRDLFEIFGYAVDVINVWFAQDGKSLIGPDDPVTDSSQDIVKTTVVRADPMLVDYSTDGFGVLEIPLLFRPENDMSVEGWMVKTSSDLYEPLKNAAESWGSLETDTVARDAEGYIISPTLHGMLPSGAVVGYSQVLVNQELNGIKARTQGQQFPLNKYGVKYDKYRNILTVTFDHFIEFKADERLFLFVTYEREKLEIPASMVDLRSNRFDIRILNRINGEEVDARTLEHLFDFIYDLKAFHSILRKISFHINVASVYNVTDFCVGKDQLAEPGTTMGEAQVPPAIIPTQISDQACDEDSIRRNFKDSDIRYRNDVITGLQEEFAAWKGLDCTHKIPEDQIALMESLTRISINPESLRETCENCEYTKYGQDSKFVEDFDPDHDADPRETACDVTRPAKGYCYTGRVKDQISVNAAVPMTDVWRFAPCHLMMGEGFYFEMPPIEVSSPIRFQEIKNLRRSILEGRLVRSLAFNGNLQYTQEEHLSSRVFNGLSQYHLGMPQMGIQKDNMFLPGHRYPTMNKLEEDYTHDTWFLRPWDDQANTNCRGGASAISLDWEMGIDSNGDEVLVFSETPLTYFGNGLTPDIPNMGDHSAVLGVTEPPFVTHSIYTTETGTHEAITWDGTVVEIEPTSGQDACLGTDAQGPVFDSAAPSG